MLDHGTVHSMTLTFFSNVWLNCHFRKDIVERETFLLNGLTITQHFEEEYLIYLSFFLSPTVESIIIFHIDVRSLKWQQRGEYSSFPLENWIIRLKLIERKKSNVNRNIFCRWRFSTSPLHRFRRSFEMIILLLEHCLFSWQILIKMLNGHTSIVQSIMDWKEKKFSFCVKFCHFHHSRWNSHRWSRLFNVNQFQQEEMENNWLIDDWE